MTRSDAPRRAARAVLDSNVWIDILVFDDPATRPILAALEAGTLTALIDSRCLHELERVLDYPQFSTRQIDKAAALTRIARLTLSVAPGELPAEPALPRCKDRDDQKFLELAYLAGADWLVSKDRALLKLARRTARDFGFHIGTPGTFVELALAEGLTA
jgi:uncharacterized protein